MWLWIKRWLDWAMSDVLPLTRSRPHGQAIHTRYEKAGLVLYDLPVPWSADAVIVEVNLRLPAPARKKADFSIRLPGADPVQPESLRSVADDRHRLLFRLGVPPVSTVGELLWKQKYLSRIAIPVLKADDFLSGLRLTMPTVSVRLEGQTVAAQSFAAVQCRGMIASCVLKSPTPLAPIADLGLRAVFRSGRTGSVYEVPAALSSSQLRATEAVVTAVAPRHPRRVGEWTVSWNIGSREVTSQRVQAIPAKRFEQSLRVSDTRFVSGDKSGSVKVAKQPPLPGEVARLGPCFLVASSEPGMAGMCRLQVHAAISGDTRSSLLMEQDMLVTDGPTVFAPGMIEAEDLTRVTGFELRHKGKLLGSASLSPIPTAALNAEGGFKPPPEFIWSNAADDELSDRLGRLMGGSS
jgi:hypothetical protein